MEWLWWAQLAFDVLVLAALGWLWWRLRPGKAAPSLSTPADVQRFIGEAARLSQEFDRLLAEKRELVGTTLKTLDDRINRMQAMASQLKNPPRAAAPAPTPTPATSPATPAAAVPDFRAQVLQLAAQGKSAPEIAESTGRPRGEVELVLGLTGKA